VRAYVVILLIAAALGMRCAWGESAAHQGNESQAAHPAPTSGATEKAVPAKAKADAPAPHNKPGAEVKSGPPDKAASTPAIDTRIGMPDGKPRKSAVVPDRKTIGIAPPWLKANALRPTNPVDHSPRNTIGIPSPTHLPGAAKAPNYPHSQPPALNHPMAPLIVTNHPVIATAPHPIAPPIAHVAPLTNTAVVSGTGMTRPGSGPGTIGGAAKKVTGINGTSIRPKY
jgi:hypothetical protein